MFVVRQEAGELRNLLVALAVKDWGAQRGVSSTMFYRVLQGPEPTRLGPSGHSHGPEQQRTTGVAQSRG